ncbi:MAG: hypothetical protein JW891_13475, partial [Candidatus Lokiarchaeota archaeon]|nr:hypothetical protein [Candidatus Lokiarchaeota archaeon]
KSEIDVEVFLRRAERPFKEKIGEDKAENMLEKIKKAANEIPAKFRRTIGSEIPKYVFNFSQEIEDISPETVEGVLLHVLLFAESLKDLVNKTGNEVNKMLIDRSGNQMRNLSDLLDAFVNKAKIGSVLENANNFDGILSFMLGGKVEAKQFSDVDLFVNRAEKNFSQRLSEEKLKGFNQQFNDVLQKVDGEIQEYMRSELPKYFFKLSQNLDAFSKEVLQNILDHTISFLIALADISGKTMDQVNQELLRRSKGDTRTILDLYIKLIQSVSQGTCLESNECLENVISHLFGKEEVRQQFSDIEAFLKRSEKKYATIIGEDMIQMLIEEFLDAIETIPEIHREYLGSDLAKYIFKRSETASYHEPEKVELMFNTAIMFANSLSEIEDLNKAEINQFLINRSERKVRSLFDLYIAFLEKNAVRSPLALDPTFDEVLNHTLGRYSGPKMIEDAGLIHEIVNDLHEEIPLTKEHSSWATSIMSIIPRYLEILPNGKGDRIMDLLWENKLSEEQIEEDFRTKVAEIPREHEKPFLFKLLHLLTHKILMNEEDDKALTAAVAFRILGSIFIDMFSGRNAQIRGIRLNSLIKERKIANPEHKNEIDVNIKRILDEDLKSLMQKTMTINTIIPIINKKGYFIKIYDIVTKDMPQPVLKLITEREADRIKDIGQEYKKESVSGELIPLVNNILIQLELARGFYKKYFEEMYTISMDAQKNMLSLRKFFKMLVEISDNTETISFYDFSIANTEHILYMDVLKYLYELLPEILSTTRMILTEQEYQTKIMKLDKYLSNEKLEELHQEIKHTQDKINEYEQMEEFDTTQKILNLNKALQRDTNEIKYYDIMFKVLNEAEKIHDVVQSRLDFAKKILTYSNSLKKVHPNLPAAIPDYLARFAEFGQEIDKIVDELKKKSETGIISPFDLKERNDAAVDSKKELNDLISNEQFMEHLNKMLDNSKKEFFDYY